MQRYSSLLKTTDEVSAGHYYRSKKGKQLATEICFQITKFLKKKAVKQKNSTKHVVVHTPMPASDDKPFLFFEKENTEPAAIAIYKALLVFFSRQRDFPQ